MTRFQIDTLKHGDVESIHLRGHLVPGQSIDELRQKMDNLASHGESQFVFDLEEVTSSKPLRPSAKRDHHVLPVQAEFQLFSEIWMPSGNGFAKSVYRK